MNSESLREAKEVLHAYKDFAEFMQSKSVVMEEKQVRLLVALVEQYCMRDLNTLPSEKLVVLRKTAFNVVHNLQSREA